MVLGPFLELSSTLIIPSLSQAFILLTDVSTMKKVTPFIILIAFIGTSCKSVKSLFENKTPHEKYAKKLERKKVDDSPEARQWLAVSERALVNAIPIQLPYRQNGYFHADKPHSLGLLFKASMGERITFNINKKHRNALVIYADVFSQMKTINICFLQIRAALNSQLILQKAERIY
jgi:hypothetical protein